MRARQSPFFRGLLLGLVGVVSLLGTLAFSRSLAFALGVFVSRLFFRRSTLYYFVVSHVLIPVILSSQFLQASKIMQPLSSVKRVLEHISESNSTFLGYS